MHESIHESGYVYVLIQDPGGNEQIVGQQFAEDEAAFIPAFAKKEEATACRERFVLKDGGQYEVQAMHYEELLARAGEGGFLVFLLDGAGKIVEMVTP